VPQQSFDKLAVAETSPHRMEPVGPASGVVANDCTTRLENAMEPSFGNTYIRGIRGLVCALAFTKRSSSHMALPFRCSLSGRLLGVPARSLCTRVRAARLSSSSAMVVIDELQTGSNLNVGRSARSS
jgi:hypothetical protein